MRRSYRREKYLGIIERVRAAMPDAAISTDIIVGFPGETEDDFVQTLEVVREARFAAAFTFQYSIRPGTPAATMPDQVPPAVVRERYERLVDVVNEISWAENQALVGSRVELLVAEGEGRKDAATPRLTGRARDNRLVHFAPRRRVLRCLDRWSRPSGPGDVVEVEITYAAPHHLVADGPVLAHRRTRSGDAWEARTAPTRHHRRRPRACRPSAPPPEPAGVDDSGGSRSSDDCESPLCGATRGAGSELPGPPALLEQQPQPGRRGARPHVGLSPPQPDREQPGERGVEIALEVEVPLARGVVEEPPVELDDQAERAIDDVAVERAAHGVAHLSLRAGQPVGPFDEDEVVALEHRAGALRDVGQHARQEGTPGDPRPGAERLQQPGRGGPPRLYEIGEAGDGPAVIGCLRGYVECGVLDADARRTGVGQDLRVEVREAVGHHTYTPGCTRAQYAAPRRPSSNVVVDQAVLRALGSEHAALQDE